MGNNKLQTVDNSPPSTALQKHGPSLILRFGNFTEAMTAAQAISTSALVPQAYRGKPADILVCWQYGAELGLLPLQALQSIAVINGKPGLYGDGLLAVAMSHPEYAGMVEEFDGKRAVCTVKRRGRPDMSGEFTVDMAKRAGLWGKQGPWTQYPERMLQMRARGFVLRDAFADALKGFKTAEELLDYGDAPAAAEQAPAAAAKHAGGALAAHLEAKQKAAELPKESADDTVAEWTDAFTAARDHAHLKDLFDQCKAKGYSPDVYAKLRPIAAEKKAQLAAEAAERIPGEEG